MNIFFLVLSLLFALASIFAADERGEFLILWAVFLCSGVILTEMKKRGGCERI